MTAMTALPLEAGHIFYEALFRDLPETRRLLPDDLDKQSAKLVDMVFLVVHSLDAIEALASEIEELGRRHDAYGVLPVHLNTAKSALLEAFAATLDDWDDADRAAWDGLLTALVAAMSRGMCAATPVDVASRTA